MYNNGGLQAPRKIIISKYVVDAEILDYAQ